jgi:hypothetical protein
VEAAGAELAAAPRAPQRSVRGAFALSLLGLANACGGSDEPATRALLELERLAFVASGHCELEDDTDLSLARALVFDRFEVTRADFAHYFGTRTRAQHEGFVSDAALDTPERADWPAFFSFYEGEELARLRGMRLPTPKEWLRVAVGRHASQWPWGGVGRKYFANTWVIDDEGHDFSLGLPSRVGTYENGVSRPFGCYDLLGNVWEWVDGLVPGFDSAVPSAFDDLDDEGGKRASIMGGAYNSPLQWTHQRIAGRRFHARVMHKNELAPWVGGRMCAYADEYLWAKAGEWGSSAAAAARVRAVARRWVENDALARADLRALLARLAERPDPPRGLAWLAEGQETP